MAKGGAFAVFSPRFMENEKVGDRKHQTMHETQILKKFAVYSEKSKAK